MLTTFILLTSVFVQDSKCILCSSVNLIDWVLLLIFHAINAGLGLPTVFSSFPHRFFRPYGPFLLGSLCFFLKRRLCFCEELVTVSLFIWHLPQHPFHELSFWIESTYTKVTPLSVPECMLPVALQQLLYNSPATSHPQGPPPTCTTWERLHFKFKFIVIPFEFLRIKPMALCMLDQLCSTELTPNPHS